jgi:hypothetical protein
VAAFGRKTYRIKTSALQSGDMLWHGSVVQSEPVKLNDNNWKVVCLSPDNRLVPQYLCDITYIVDTIDNEVFLKLNEGDN